MWHAQLCLPPTYTCCFYARAHIVVSSPLLPPHFSTYACALAKTYLPSVPAPHPVYPPCPRHSTRHKSMCFSGAWHSALAKAPKHLMVAPCTIRVVSSFLFIHHGCWLGADVRMRQSLCTRALVILVLLVNNADRLTKKIPPLDNSHPPHTHTHNPTWSCCKFLCGTHGNE